MDRGAASDLSHRVLLACELIPDEISEGRLDDHIRWELDELMGRLTPDDLTSEERMALVAVLAKAHSRKRGQDELHSSSLAGRPFGRPGLRLVGAPDGFTSPPGAPTGTAGSAPTVD